MERLTFALICAVTLIFAILTPPFQAPDENQHYMKALFLAEGGLMAQTQGNAIGAALSRAALDLRNVDFPAEQPGKLTRYGMDQIGVAMRADGQRPGRAFGDFPNVANYAPTLYLPQAVGLAIGDALGLPHLGALYVGRIVNALTALLLLYAALRLLPFGRMALLAVAVLPTSTYQAGSLSPDAGINAAGWLALAISLRIGFGDMKWERGRAGALLFSVAPLLALAKGVYLPLILSGLRWPPAREARRAWMARSGMLILSAAMGAIAFIVWMKFSGGTQALYHIVSRKTGELTITAPLAEQLSVVLRDPIGFLRILATSVAERSPVYVLQIVGRFGWNSILLPLVAYPLASCMLLAALLSGDRVQVTWGVRLWWLAIAVGAALLVETALYLTGTPLGADYVQGVQGRYFLPILPLALMALSFGSLRPAISRTAGRLCLCLAVALSLMAVVTVWDAFWYHGFATYDGMPPSSGIMRSLFLPSHRWLS
ncbi:DUF2142 domain-containing protein [Sphingobium sp. H39-3-25]|uniref:DUF2142 domain-containing protein n=1 Tax=Sphingobium arseniciresistens TaxID=3030834 RepID=UPI0023B8A71E|nr:DUF2142 domain-containing protein [Sphingobium arseniciresistens]